uniref:Methyltransferase type 11 domain-containing protein n=1 Tax=Ralstonia solanacearum TaxID=305 RepID=A0A0S4TZI4_RALSL|nr:protein of unknown function [Ralstonia solanacearum]
MGPYGSQSKSRATLATDTAPGFAPADLAERGQLLRLGHAVKLNDYAPLTLPPANADLVSCFIGLHHMAPEKLQPFLESVARVLRPGGWFVLRGHDVASTRMEHFVALAHTVFNAGLGEPWAVNAAEPRGFASAAACIAAPLRHQSQPRAGRRPARRRAGTLSGRARPAGPAALFRLPHRGHALGQRRHRYPRHRWQCVGDSRHAVEAA